MRTRLLIVLAVLAWSAPALAQFTQEMTIVVGKSEPVALRGPIDYATCDDISIVQIDISGPAVRLHALKPGKTLCGFWTLGVIYHTLITVTVIEEPPEEKAPPPPRDSPDGGGRNGDHPPG